MNEALPYKELDLFPFEKRVMFFDATHLSDLLSNRKFRRHPFVQIHELFPKQEGVCGCGCGAILTGRRKRWASEECHDFTSSVWAIFAGRTGTIEWFLSKYYGFRCCKCNDTSDLKTDHIIPVKHGGGACWLSNYQFLCHDCHVKKTNSDFGWKNRRTEKMKEIELLSNQTTLELA